MASGDFGGDHSVEWNVFGDNVRQERCESPAASAEKPKPAHHWGIDESALSGAFTIAIKLPRVNPNDFITQLRTVNAVGGVVSLTVPIEDVQSGYDPPTSKQIVVSWPSDPNANPAGRKAVVSASKAGKPVKTSKRPRKQAKKRRSKKR